MSPLFTRGEKFVIGLVVFLVIALTGLFVLDMLDYSRFNTGCEARGGFTVRASDGHRKCVAEVGK